MRNIMLPRLQSPAGGEAICDSKRSKFLAISSNKVGVSLACRVRYRVSLELAGFGLGSGLRGYTLESPVQRWHHGMLSIWPKMPTSRNAVHGATGKALTRGRTDHFAQRTGSWKNGVKIV